MPWLSIFYKGYPGGNLKFYIIIGIFISQISIYAVASPKKTVSPTPTPTPTSTARCKDSLDRATLKKSRRNLRLLQDRVAEVSELLRLHLPAVISVKNASPAKQLVDRSEARLVIGALLKAGFKFLPWNSASADNMRKANLLVLYPLGTAPKRSAELHRRAFHQMQTFERSKYEEKFRANLRLAKAELETVGNTVVQTTAGYTNRGVEIYTPEFEMNAMLLALGISFPRIHILEAKFVRQLGGPAIEATLKKLED